MLGSYSLPAELEGEAEEEGEADGEADGLLPGAEGAAEPAGGARTIMSVAVTVGAGFPDADGCPALHALASSSKTDNTQIIVFFISYSNLSICFCIYNIN